jgi:hypothetical protein
VTATGGELTGDEAAVDIVDLSQAEELMGLPPIDIRPYESEPDAAGNLQVARFTAAPDGVWIDFDLDAALHGGMDPNAALLHELVHVWQWLGDPAGFKARVEWELAEYGYADAPHEVEARKMAATMVDAGVQVYWPAER